MKLRIKNNGIRYRITKSDMDRLITEGFLKETVNFGDDELVYVLQSSSEKQMGADFKNNIITLYMPTMMVKELAGTETVGFEHYKGALHLLVEKDFTCLDKVAEDQSDNYPNPLAERRI